MAWARALLRKFRSVTSLIVLESGGAGVIRRRRSSFPVTFRYACSSEARPLLTRVLPSLRTERAARMASWQYIYQMNGLSKAYPGGKRVLDDIHLSFYPDAKIGILGVNGAGKSTLMRIMAGMDKEFTGEAQAAPGSRVEYLSQEPQLDPKKTVRENVMDGVAD